MSKNSISSIDELANKLHIDKSGPDLKNVPNQDETLKLVNEWYSAQCTRIREGYKTYIDSDSLDNLNYLIQERYDELKTLIALKSNHKTY